MRPLAFFGIVMAILLCPDWWSGVADSGVGPNSDFSIQEAPLDDTAGFIHLTPNPIHTLCETSFHIAIIATLTDARVFDLTFLLPQAFFQLRAVTPGSEPSLHILPEYLSGDTLWLDGFFHPNFTGTTTLAILTVHSLCIPGDDTSRIGFLDGQGYSGTADFPEVILLSGDTTTIYIECTPPENPWEMIIIPIQTDSVCLRWHPIFFDVDGDTVINPTYVIYRMDQLLLPPTLDSIGATFDTFFYDDYIQIWHPLPPDTAGSISYLNATTYEVRARKTQP
ncbi:MAG: hypothetical protein V1784_11100 [bacterium]